MLGKRIRVAFQGGQKVDLGYLLHAASKLSGQGGASTPEDRLDWLESLLIWIRAAGGGDSSPSTGLKFLLQRLEQNPAWAEGVSGLLGQVLNETSALRLFSEIGVPSHFTFVKEVQRRLLRAALPPAGDPLQLSTSVERAFSRSGDPRWLEELPPEIWRALMKLARAKGPHPRMLADACEAAVLLSIRVSALALQEDLAARTGIPDRVEGNPFLELVDATRAFRQDNKLPRVQDALARAHGTLDGVRESLERSGVSMELVFQLEQMTACLQRVETLTSLVWHARTDGASADFQRDVWFFFVELVRCELQERKIRILFRDNLRLLARKLVERAGDTGESLIARTPAEWRTMFWASAGGGALTLLTAVFKYLEPDGLPPFFKAAYLALNFSMSFSIMHFLGLKLATKQPAMTASTLAARLSGGTGDSEFVTEVARICRTQIAAVAGNLLAVIPAAFLFDRVLVWMGVGHFLTHEESNAVIQSVHPLATGTLYYAAVTGVLLWMSGLAGGWVENAYVSAGVPGALRRHRFMRAFFTPARWERLVGRVAGHLSGVGSAVALGLLLAFVPSIAEYFGFPLKVRHITLMTGSVALGVSGLETFQLGMDRWLSVFFGLAGIAVMNFGVSFGLSLAVAVRARSVPLERVNTLLIRCGLEFLRSPRRFLMGGDITGATQ